MTIIKSRRWSDNLSPGRSYFSFGIIWGRLWRSLAVENHLWSILGIICSLGIICGTVQNPILSESLDLPQVCACLCLTDVASFIIICYDLSVLPPLVKKLRLSTVSPQMLHYRLQSTELSSIHKLEIC